MQWSGRMLQLQLLWMLKKTCRLNGKLGRLMEEKAICWVSRYHVWLRTILRCRRPSKCLGEASHLLIQFLLPLPKYLLLPTVHLTWPEWQQMKRVQRQWTWCADERDDETQWLENNRIFTWVCFPPALSA